jgi:hypothetical protein
VAPAVDGDGQLGDAAQSAAARRVHRLAPFSRMILRFAALALDAAAAAIVVQRAMMLLVAGAVDGQRLAAQLQQLAPGEQRREQVEHAAAAPRRQQRIEGAPQRVVIRRVRQPDLRQPRRRVRKQRFGASKAQGEELAHNQADEELRQGEVVS